MDDISHNVQSPDGGDKIEQVDSLSVRLEVDRIGLRKKPLFMERSYRAVHMRSRSNQDELAIVTRSEDLGSIDGTFVGVT
jgi:hypothetical protein